MHFEWKSLKLSICSSPEYLPTLLKISMALSKSQKKNSGSSEKDHCINNIKLQMLPIGKMWPGIGKYDQNQRPEENEKKQMNLYAGTKLTRCHLHPLLYRLFSRNNANISKAE